MDWWIASPGRDWLWWRRIRCRRPRVTPLRCRMSSPREGDWLARIQLFSPNGKSPSCQVSNWKKTCQWAHQSTLSEETSHRELARSSEPLQQHLFIKKKNNHQSTGSLAEGYVFIYLFFEEAWSNLFFLFNPSCGSGALVFHCRRLFFFPPFDYFQEL